VPIFVRLFKSLVAGVLLPFRWYTNTVLTAHSRDSGSALGPIENEDE
jgi:hypothetical protein